MLWSNLPATSKVSAKRGIVYDWKKSQHHVIFHEYVHCIIIVGILGLILDNCKKKIIHFVLCSDNGQYELCIMFK